jgi:hypothetical protein
MWVLQLLKQLIQNDRMETIRSQGISEQVIPYRFAGYHPTTQEALVMYFYFYPRPWKKANPF